LDRVFDRFSQADGRSTRTHAGLGLGLSIVRHIVELHGGRVTVESEGPGHGSTFTVHLPTVRATAENAPISPRIPSPGEDGNGSLAGLRVLVVDDQEDTRELIAIVLSERGASVLQAGSVREALAVLQSKNVDLLLSDIAMPEEDGYALMKQLRQLFVARQHPAPIAVALTAYAGEEDAQRILRAGYSVHIPKPVEPDRLLQKIALAVAGQRTPIECGSLGAHTSVV
jgi:CheY-like chemotaxis protein